MNNGNITDSHASGNVTGSSSSYGDVYVGGLVGNSGYGSIANSYATGDVTGSSSSSSSSYSVYIGGLAGSSSSSITNCYATGDVTSSSSRVYAGGLTGSSSGSITNSYATGDVTTSTSSNYNYAGGLVGNSGSSITNCYATGDVTGGSTNYNYLGGLVGQNNSNGSITNCYATGNITGTTTSRNSSVGALVGVGGSNILNCYFLRVTGGPGGVGNSSSDDGNVVGLTTAQMKSKSNFPGFNFSTIWNMDEGRTYPYLRGVGRDYPGSPADIRPLPDAATLRAHASGGLLHIDGLTAGEPFAVYDIRGRLLHAGRASGSEQTVALTAEGILVVAAGGQSIKVFHQK
jgi:hypothetical protein